MPHWKSKPSSPLPFRTLLLSYAAIFAATLLWSSLTPDHFTWALEVFPTWIGVALLLYTRHRFPLTPLLYTLILLHCMVLMVGGKYTYAQVPAGFWVQDWLHLARNPYDRLGHFFQGLVPAILAREILIRRQVLAKPAWLFFLVCSLCLAFSALYELLEWQTAVWKGEAAEAFLGTQGDVWDTQWDMAMALVGAVVGQWVLGKWHDRQIAKVSCFGQNC